MAVVIAFLSIVEYYRVHRPGVRSSVVHVASPLWFCCFPIAGSFCPPLLEI